MDKEIIKKLFQGTKEDQIIACSLIAEKKDLIAIMKEWENLYSLELKKYYGSFSSRKEPERPVVIFKYRSSIFNDTQSFYYKLPNGHYLVCEPGGIGYCYENYTKSCEVINHF